MLENTVIILRVLLNKNRFCKTIASVTSVDLRLQVKEILSARNSKQTKPQSISETQEASSLDVRSKNAF